MLTFNSVPCKGFNQAGGEIAHSARQALERSTISIGSSFQSISAHVKPAQQSIARKVSSKICALRNRSRTGTSDRGREGTNFQDVAVQTESEGQVLAGTESANSTQDGGCQSTLVGEGPKKMGAVGSASVSSKASSELVSCSMNESSDASVEAGAEANAVAAAAAAEVVEIAAEAAAEAEEVPCYDYWNDVIEEQTGGADGSDASVSHQGQQEWAHEANLLETNRGETAEAIEASTKVTVESQIYDVFFFFF